MSCRGGPWPALLFLPFPNGAPRGSQFISPGTDLFTPHSCSRNHSEISSPFGAWFPPACASFEDYAYVMARFGSFKDKILPRSFVFSASIASPFVVLLFAAVFLAPAFTPCRAQEIADDACPRPSQGSAVPEPQDLRSQNGVLKVDLTVHNFRDQSGSTRYCYVSADGSQSPTLRLNPGDLLILTLKNDLTEPQHAAASSTQTQSHSHAKSANDSDPCVRGAMTSTSTNLHFHGLTVPPICHQDDVLKTSIQPGDAPFEYRFRIPANEPPGLYWYHPHIHGFSKTQVLGGASGRAHRRGHRARQSPTRGFAGTSPGHTRSRSAESEFSAFEVGTGRAPNPA